MAQKIYIRIILLSSSSIASIYLVLSIIRNDDHQLFNLFIDFFKIFIFSVFFWILNLQIFSYTNKHFSQRSAYIIIIFSTSFLAYFVMLYLSTYLSIINEVKGIKPSGIGFRGVVANLLIITFLYSTNIFSKYKEIEAENEKLKRNQLENQLLQLKAQLNPHFLFNSLNTLKAMVEDKDENSVEYLIKLSEVYRYFLENSDSNLASIKDELNIANAYFFMLKNRFEDNISLEISLSDNDYERKIPSMSIQLLIENAVKHNVISRSKPLIIKVFSQNNFIVIQNNYQPKRNTEPSTKIGLENLNNRCKILLNKDLLFEKTDYYFIVKLPLL
ncbi:sensor histidine kinase [Emticicia sp. 17c]|uniref:sensor histidine kinase n=1 Tax=Emticicia sp. 17c TaxID=3127704 RepID=UPI00301DABAF